MVMRELGRRLRGGLVFGAWAGTLIALVLTDRARLFLRPEFAWLLGLGALIAIGFLLAIMRGPVPLPLSRTLILLLPLLHLAASDPASMGQGVFSKRFLGLHAQSAAEFGPAVRPGSAFGTYDTVPDEVIARGFAGQEETTMFSSESGLTILQLLRAPEGHVGSTVRLLGLLHRDSSLSRHFGPGRETALYRFVVSCCAADALPVTVALDGNVPDLPADQWVEVEGRFELVHFGNGTVPLVQAHRISPVDPPADPFLY